MHPSRDEAFTAWPCRAVCVAWTALPAAEESPFAPRCVPLGAARVGPGPRGTCELDGSARAPAGASTLARVAPPWRDPPVRVESCAPCLPLAAELTPGLGRPSAWSAKARPGLRLPRRAPVLPATQGSNCRSEGRARAVLRSRGTAMAGIGIGFGIFR